MKQNHSRIHIDIFFIFANIESINIIHIGSEQP